MIKNLVHCFIINGSFCKLFLLQDVSLHTMHVINHFDNFYKL